jgi:hypothetical protein
MATEIRWAAAMLAAAGTFVAAGCRTAAERPSGTSAAATASSAETGTSAYELAGRVEGIDPSNNTIQIGGRTVRVDSSTSVMKGGVGATFDDIKEGDEVRASLSLSGEQPKAERIVVTSGTNP